MKALEGSLCFSLRYKGQKVVESGYLRIWRSSVLDVQLQGSHRLLLFNQVSRIQSHVFVKDLKILQKKSNLLLKKKHSIVWSERFPTSFSFSTVTTELCLRSSRHLFRSRLQTLLPLASLCVHVQRRHDVDAHQLSTQDENNRQSAQVPSDV